MSLVRRTMADDFREMNRLMTRMFGSDEMQLPTLEFKTELARNDWTPSVDVEEDAERYLIKAELPQVKREDVKIGIEDGVLTLSGERRQTREDKGKKLHRVECSYGSFFRSFRLPDNVDESGVQADYADGMLSITLPKTAKPKQTVREIPVR